MSKTSEKRTLEIKEMEAGLKSKDDAIVLKTVKTFRKKGATNLLPLLFRVYGKTKNEALQQAIFAVLIDLHEDDAIAPVMEALKDEKLQHIRPQLLSALWQSRLDSSAYMIDLTAIAAKGDFIETMEAVTVLQQLEGSFNEEALLESMVLLKQELEKDLPAEKKALLSDLLQHLKALDAKI